MGERGRSAEVRLVYRVPAPGLVPLEGQARPVHLTQGGADLDLDPDGAPVGVPRAVRPVEVRSGGGGDPDDRVAPPRLSESAHLFHRRRDSLTYVYDVPTRAAARVDVEAPPGVRVRGGPGRFLVAEAPPLPPI